MKVFRLLTLTLLLSATTAGTALAQDKLKVVATFSILGDLVQQVASDKVDLTVLVGPNGDTHVYEPTPSDAVAIAQADLVILNGLEFEGWLPRLLESAEYQGPQLVLGEQIEAMPFHDHDEEEDHHDHDEAHHEHEHHHDEDGHHDEHDEGHHHHHGEFDPHAWQSVPNVIQYVAAISEQLQQLDPENARFYRYHRDYYSQRLSDLQSWAETEFDALPTEHRRLITPHDAFGYLARDFDLHIESPQGLSTESEASAQKVAQLIRQVRDENIAALFVENIANDALVRQIERETDARVGGTLYTGALSASDGPAPTYEAMMRHNFQTLLTALAPE
ncbi:zinc ABC transporter substrate-binding protein [Saccharospirillum sp. HFRX-1]|uniref:metal ABC transporter solute-binding protein, Zn/Mn family n=1 Tax=unclassified Saccharospirillum TaxID=2633430 RepID=UPI003711169B